MDLRFLESFICVCDCGSIAEAARRLHVTPAALAQRLRTLEQDLGQPLVERVGRVVQPTASGLAILEAAKGVIEAAHDLRSLAAKDEPAGLLRLGATATAMTGLLPGILSRLRPRHPQIDYYMRPGNSSELYAEVLAGGLDAALIVKPPFVPPKTSGWMTLRAEPLVLILPENLPGDDPQHLLREHPFIRYDRNQWGGQLVDRYLRDAGLTPKEWLELDALDAITALVDRGLGVAILPDFARPWPEGLRLRKLALPGNILRETGVLWTRSGPRMRAVEAFVAACAN